MSEGTKEEKLANLIQDGAFVLLKMSAIKFDKSGDFDPKDIRGTYVFNNVSKIDSKHIKAIISVHLYYGEETQKKFFDLECEYSLDVSLKQELTREIGLENDNIDLLNYSFNYVDKITSPILSSMGYSVKLG